MGDRDVLEPLTLGSAHWGSGHRGPPLGRFQCEGCALQCSQQPSLYGVTLSIGEATRLSEDAQQKPWQSKKPQVLA
jgi:hypothetical protein